MRFQSLKQDGPTASGKLLLEGLEDLAQQCPSPLPLENHFRRGRVGQFGLQKVIKAAVDLVGHQHVGEDRAGAELEACTNQLEVDGRAMVLEASGRARATLSSLESLLKNLAPLKMPVNLVMISEGMFVARDRQE